MPLNAAKYALGANMIGRAVILRWIKDHPDDLLGGIRAMFVKGVENITPEVWTAYIASGTMLVQQFPEGLMNLMRNMAREPEVVRLFEENVAKMTPALLVEWLHSPHGDKPLERLSDGEVGTVWRTRRLEAVIINWPGPEATQWLGANISQMRAAFESAMTTVP